MPNFHAARSPSASFRYRKRPGVVRSNAPFGKRTVALSRFKCGSPAPRDRLDDEEEGPQERDERNVTTKSDDEMSVRSCAGLDSGNGSPPSRGVDGLILWSNSDTVRSNHVPGALLYDVAEDEEYESMHKKQEEGRGRRQEEDAGGREHDDVAVEVLNPSTKSSRMYLNDHSSRDSEVPILIFSDTYSDDLSSRHGSTNGDNPTAPSYVSAMSMTTVKAANTTHLSSAIKSQMTLGTALVKAIEEIDAEVKEVNVALRRMEAKKRARRRVRYGRTETKKKAEGQVHRDPSPRAARQEASPTAEECGDAYDWRHAFEVFMGFMTNELDFRGNPKGKSGGEQPMGRMIFM